MLPGTCMEHDPDGGIKRVLRTLAEAFWPAHPEEAAASEVQHISVFWRTSGSDFDVSGEVLNTLRSCAHGINQVALILALHLLRWRLGTVLMAGRHCLSTSWPFILTLEDMPVKQRQAMLVSWAHSWLRPMRQAFKALKSLIMAMLFSVVDDKGRNPFWAAMRYPPGRDVRPISGPLASACEAEEVLASGVVHLPGLLALPGLDVQAYLSKRGFSTTAGDLSTHSTSTHTASVSPNSNMKGHQHQRPQQLHNDTIHHGGASDACTKEPRSADALELFADAVVLGSGAGGATAAAVLAAAGMKVLVVEKSTWRRLSDLTALERESAQAMYEGAGFVMTECSGVNLLAGSTLGGGTKVNWTVSFRTPDHVRQEWATEHGLPSFAPGPGPFTDALDAVCKRMGVHTDDHHNAPNAKLLEGLAAVNGKPEAMPRNCLAPEECNSYCAFGCKKGGKQSSDVTFLADAVKRGARVLTGCYAERVLVVKDKIGRCIHRLIPASYNSRGFPMSDAQRAGTAQGPMDMHLGPPMSVCSKAVADWEGSGYGAIVSVPCIHPGMLGCLTTWSPSLKEDALPIADMALNVVYARDRTEGRVCIDWHGRPRIHYWPNQQDRHNILKGMELAIRAGLAAGAVKITVPFLTDTAYEVGPDHSGAKLQRYIDRLWANGLRHTDAGLFSAHQMGSSRMGASPRTSVCDANGECWEVSGLYVADASAFPTASGANPMITVAAVAYMNAHAIVRRAKARQEAMVTAA